MAVILIASHFTMASIRTALVVLMTIQIAGEFAVIPGLKMAGSAVLPPTGMSAGKNGKKAFVLAKVSRMPIEQGVAFIAFQRKAHLSMHGILGLTIQLAMTSKTGRLQHGKLPLYLANMTGLAVQSRMCPDQREGSACMGAAHIKNLPS